jgi:hypothetical protein
MGPFNFSMGQIWVGIGPSLTSKDVAAEHMLAAEFL